jgi:hypothetical protein
MPDIQGAVGLSRPPIELGPSAMARGLPITPFQRVGLEARRSAVAIYLNRGNWRIIAEFTEVESGPQFETSRTRQRLGSRPPPPVPARRQQGRPPHPQRRLPSRLLEAGVNVRFADLPQIEGATGRFMLQQMWLWPSSKRV